MVVADNCTDDTAQLAAAAGASVLVREEPNLRGKGRALRWAMDAVLDGVDASMNRRPDAFVIVDADSVADPSLLAGLAGHFEAGSPIVQAEYLILEDMSSARMRIRAVAFLLFHHVRFSGRAALGMPCHLVGNGILVSRELVETHPWDAFTGAEDLEYSISLRVEGILPVFAREALVRGPAPATRAAAQVQRERWEGGRLHVIRTSVPRLVREIVRHGRASLVETLVDLLVPPLGLLAVGASAGTVAFLAIWSQGLVPIWVPALWIASTVSIVGFVLIGLLAAGAPGWMYSSLLLAPAFIMRKLLGTLGVLRHRPVEKWIRTERPSEIVS